VVKVKSDSLSKIYFLIESLFSFGLLPIKVSEVLEYLPGNWEIELVLAYFLNEDELNNLISLILAKGGEEE